jgi:D-serine deaminase-like pyridoxal phosphate-dependent protein
MITKPTLLVDEVQARKNIRMMLAKANASKVDFRPHFKTHFSADIGEWYRAEGINKITVSSIDMAVYFANHGWDDITIAFPVNILEVAILNDLAKRITLNLIVVSLETVQFLNQNMPDGVNVWLKIDTGYSRTGIPANQMEYIQKIISEIQAPLNFKGILAHFGHSYKTKGKSEIQKIYNEGISKLTHLKNEIQVEDCLISIGDTPSCSLINEFKGVDEIRPGNFIFYDLMQEQIGSCSLDKIAVCMACPVVAIHPERNEIVVHGGAVHFSKEHIINQAGNNIYGKVVSLNSNGWGKTTIEQVYLKSVSQEHGIISATKEFISKTKVGDVLGILPIHSCLTANLMKDYLNLDGKWLKSMNSIN